MRPTCASFAGTAVLQQRRGRWRAPLLLGLGRSEACRLVFSTANVLDIRVLCGQGRLRQLRSAKLSAKLPRVALEGEAQRVGQRQQTHRLCARPPQPGHLRSGRLRGPSQPGQPLWCAWGFVTVTGGGRQGCWPLLSGAGKKPQHRGNLMKAIDRVLDLPCPCACAQYFARTGDQNQINQNQNQIYSQMRLDLYKETQNDNLTSDPPSALLRAGA